MDPVGAVRDALARGQRAALVSVIAVEGEPPSRLGMAFGLVEGGRTYGTLGCDGFDRSAEHDASRALASGTRLERIYDWDVSSRIHVEVRPLSPGDAVPAAVTRPELLVVGGGPVARALVTLARPLGFRVRVAQRSAEEIGGDEVVQTPDARAVGALEVGPETYVVICGHDLEFSQPSLRALLSSASPYLGMLGSRRHTGQLLAELRGARHPGSVLRRVHTPVGLDLRAQTPEEIALAALAHIVAVRRGGTGTPIA